MRRGLVFAGGFVAGVAWELGVLRGLQDVNADLLAKVIAADVVVGTSAGSTVAAQITGGTALDTLYAAQLSEASPEIEVDVDLRELMARPGLTLVPGAYDALSARIIEAQGFEAIGAGGYAAVGSMLAQPDTGQSNMRDYADHYARICAAVEVPVYVDGDTGFGGVNNARQMVGGCVTISS